MYKLFTAILLGAMIMNAEAQQTPVIHKDEAFGKVSMDDLTLQSCDFEKDANAEVLFDKGSVFFDQDYNPVLERHLRIKIFNDKAKDEGNIKIKFYGGKNGEYVGHIEAETINAENGKPSVSKVERKQIFTQKIDKYRSEIVFSFPDVKPGSVLDYKYDLTGSSLADFPDWYFQHDIPTRYSELTTNIPDILFYKNLVMVNHPFIVNTDNDKVMVNIPSVDDEPYMSAPEDNEDRILYELKSINTTDIHQSFSDTWDKVGKGLLDDEDFGGQFRRKLSGEEDIISKAKALKSDDDKIAFLFNEVKNAMKWNDDDETFVDEGTSEAWNKKTGNSAEINLILYHLLEKSGVKAYPMLVSTRDNGKINPAYPNSYQFNRTVVYAPIDSTNYYVLDATDKYNTYNLIPESLLNNFGLTVDKEDQAFNTVFIRNATPVRMVSVIQGDIKPDGKMSGHAQISDFGYNRSDVAQAFKSAGEQKYKDGLSDGDNNLKVSGLKIENMETDSLPLIQDIDFSLNLPAAADNYIYFKPAIFTGMDSNPFLSEKRSTDIDFGYQNSFSINGLYTIPAGYTVDALPKSIGMETPGGTVIFRRLTAVQGNTIAVRYLILFKKSIFFKENYPELHEFYKKMFEMLNEQVVLKKA